MSSRFRNLGPRDRRLNSQWPDVPEASGQGLRARSTDCHAPVKRGRARKGVSDDVRLRRPDIPDLSLASKSQYKVENM